MTVTVLVQLPRFVALLHLLIAARLTEVLFPNNVVISHVVRHLWRRSIAQLRVARDALVATRFSLVVLMSMLWMLLSIPFRRIWRLIGSDLGNILLY